ncbi:hypothetical protein C7974DRAFT_384363 [Boeremia exigua]|uniref:uncharacterized protein n=1 Tax=Boeremia exigua TaxID=749465 RepID=UPI001E8E69D9|nr:uncharacterized protein C7974DRAFT_384363 [Boeremia exigua]KAH6644827.1 hypothetical protein C7974DRAFT_384363 [Boeremia exigua]
MTRRRLDATEYTVGWICALPVELAAAQVMLDEEHDGHHSTQYTLGRIGNHNVVLACLQAGRMGIGPAAFSAGHLASTFPSIRLGLMVGIGGGVPSAADVRLGDVVVSQPVLQHSGVVQYDFGKTGKDGQLTRTGSMNAPPKALLHAVTQLRARRYQGTQGRDSFSTHLAAFDKIPNFTREKAGSDVLYKGTYQHDGGATCELCSEDQILPRMARESDEEVTIHYGTIASGNQVIKDGLTRDRLSKELGGVLCFEMEAAGLMNDFSCLVVRGICDYADSHKNKAWQPYAAATAAACAKDILSLVPAPEVVKAAVASKATYHVPFSLKNVPVGKFAERPRDTEALERVLLPQDNVKQRRLLAAHGLGGAGKTQLAANFARRHQNRFTSVLWLDGSSESNLKQSFAAFTSRIPEGQIPETSRLSAATQGSDIDMVVRDVLAWLSVPENSDWLLIIDNVDRDHRRCEDLEAYDVQDYLPEADHGSVLITTRLPQLGQLGEGWEVRTVDKEQAQAIFKTWYGRSVPREGDELLELLDGLPLALTQAAAYMNETGTSFNTYTRLYKEQWRELMKSRDGGDIPLRSYANGSVATTWMMSYTALRHSNEAAANLLLLWAHLNNTDLWYGMLANVSRHPPTASAERKAARFKASRLMVAWLGDIACSETAFIEAIRTLRSYSLVAAGDETGYSTHPVVHQWALHIQDDGQLIVFSRLAIGLVGWALPSDGEKQYWESQARLLPHAERCAKKVVREISRIPRGGVESRANADDEDTLLVAVCSLGSLYREQSNFETAELMYTQALEGFTKRDVVADRSSMLRLFNGLGMLYEEQGNFEKAEAMYTQSLDGSMEMYTADHLETLIVMNNLANLYRRQDRLDKAEEIFLQVLEGFKKTPGAFLLQQVVVSNLAHTYARQEKLDKAEETFLQVLEGYKKTLGEDSITTLETVAHLSMLYLERGKLDEAEGMFVQIIPEFQKRVGENHDLILGLFEGLGDLYRAQGNLEKAKETYLRALNGHKNAQGPKGIYTRLPALRTIWSLHRLSEQMGHKEDARAWCGKLLSGFEKVYGQDDHKCQQLRDRLIWLDKTEDDGEEDGGDVRCENVGPEQVALLDTGHSQLTRTSRRHRVLRKLGWRGA